MRMTRRANNTAGFFCIQGFPVHTVKERFNQVKLTQILAPALFLLLTACAVHTAGPNEEYVEIPNPMMTATPNAPATIWVPRSYVDSGVPRGGELVKQGVAKMRGPSAAADKAPQASPAAASPLAPLYPQRRLALLETGNGGLLPLLWEQMKAAGAGIVIDPAAAASLAATADLTTPAGRSALVLRLQHKYGTGVAIFISAPDGIAAGKRLVGTVYEGMGGGEVNTVSAVIPPSAADDAARNAALCKALAEIAGQVKGTVALLPWYGKVVAVEGKRVYIDAGSEAGLAIGQVLVLHGQGKVVAGLGYAPGDTLGKLEITGLVGTNGAYGESKGNREVRAEDLVTLE